MSLSAQEKADIIFQLGWPAKTLIQGSTDYSKIISDRLENLTAEIEVNIRAWLDKLVKLDQTIEAAYCRLAAKRVGDIETNQDEIYLLRKEKKRILMELSDMLDIEIMRSGSGGISVCI